IDGDHYRIDLRGETVEARIVGDEPVLSDNDRMLVAGLARRAAETLGRPQDVEWAIAGEKIYLLQSRPITALPRIDVGADPDLAIWDNSNIVESYAGVTSPLTFSFARYVYAHVYRAFAKLTGVSPRAVERSATVFENLLGRVDGRI